MAKPGGARFRHHAIRGALCLALLLQLRAFSVEEAPVPPSVQAHLLAKAAAYDRHFSARAEGVVRILLVGRAGGGQLSGRLRQALSEERVVGGLPHSEVVMDFVNAEQLKTRVRAEHTSVVYLTGGFSEREMTELARALDGVDVLTVASSPADVQRGAVLGFDLVSGHPKLLVNLAQARRQHVDFASDFLNLAQVFE